MERVKGEISTDAEVMETNALVLGSPFKFGDLIECLAIAAVLLDPRKATVAASMWGADWKVVLFTA